MTKKAGMLAVIAVIFLYTAWSFYADALRYNPLASVAFKRSRERIFEISVPKYEQVWAKEIYEKNVFSPARGYVAPKPFVPPPPPPPPPPKKPDMDLKGIVLDPYGDWIAYVSINRANPLPLRKGDKTDDVEVVDINEESVVLKWNGQDFTLSLNRIKTITNPRVAR